MSHAAVESAFPRLPGTGYQLTSPFDPAYNCIAWAAGDSGAFWEPIPSIVGSGMMGGYYWPGGFPSVATLDSYIMAFKTLGYRVCDDSSVEQGFEKVVLYTTAEGKPTHAARQLGDGTWTSKLGSSEDIIHIEPADVGGEMYGEPALFMRRKVVAGRPHPRAV